MARSFVRVTLCLLGVAIGPLEVKASICGAFENANPNHSTHTTPTPELDHLKAELRELSSKNNFSIPIGEVSEILKTSDMLKVVDLNSRLNKLRNVYLNADSNLLNILAMRQIVGDYKSMITARDHIASYLRLSGNKELKRSEIGKILSEIEHKDPKKIIDMVDANITSPSDEAAGQIRYYLWESSEGMYLKPLLESGGLTNESIAQLVGDLPIYYRSESGEIQEAHIVTESDPSKKRLLLLFDVATKTPSDNHDGAYFGQQELAKLLVPRPKK